MTTKKPQKQASKVPDKKPREAAEKKPKEVKEKPAKNEFLPVIYKGKDEHGEVKFIADKFPASAIKEAKLTKPTAMEGDYLDYAAITIKDETYYVKPFIFQK